MKKIEIPPGTRFGRLTVREGERYVQWAKRKRRAALCRCDCGAEVVISLSNLRTGNSTSCGCSKRGQTMTKEYAEHVHRNGQKAVDRLTTHGLSKHPSYNRWYNMIQRCERPHHRAYLHYGGRGIRVAPEWLDPAVFLAYVDATLGPCPPGYSLDRIDNDRGYEPGNIRWATWPEQARNRRKRRTSP